MPITLQTGGEVDLYFNRICGQLPGWQLLRSESKNLGFTVSQPIVSAIFSNHVLGKALHSGSNLIVTLLPLNWMTLNNNEKEGVELMYKHDIFLYTLGLDWISKSSEGKQLLALIFNTNHNLISNGVMKGTIHLYYEFEVPLQTLVQRFMRTIVLNRSTAVEYVRNVVLITELTEIKGDYCEVLTGVDTVLAFHLWSDLLELGVEHDLNIIWMDRSDYLEELTRELIFQVNKHLEPGFEYIEIPRSKKINGLDGI